MATTTIGELLLHMTTEGDRQVITALQRVIRQTDNARRSVKGFGSNTSMTSSISSSFNKVLGKMAVAFAALNIIGKVNDALGYFVDKIGEGIKRGMKYNTELEYTRAAIKALVGSEKEANILTEKMIKLAAETPFATEDYAKATKTLLGYGVAQDEVLPTMKMLGNIAMGDKVAFSRLALAFGQVTAKGKLQAEEVRQMVNQGFNPLKFIAEETGIKMSDLQDKMRAGEISAEMVNKAFQRATTGTGRFANTMEALSSTYKGQKEKIEEYGDIFWGKVTRPLYDFMASNVLPRLLTGIKWLTGHVETFYAAMGRAVVKVKALAKAFLSGDYDSIYEILKKIVPDSLKDKVMNLTIIVAKFRMALKWMKDRAVEAFGYLQEKTGLSVQYLKEAFMSRAIPAIKALIDTIASIDPEPFLNAFNSMLSLYRSIEPYLKTFTKYMIDLFVDKIVGIITNTEKFSGKIGKIVDAVVLVAGKMKDFYWNVLKIFIDAFNDFDFEVIITAWNRLKESLAPLEPLFKALAVVLGVVYAALKSVQTGALVGIIGALDNFIAMLLNVLTVVASFATIMLGLFTGNFKKVKQGFSNLDKACTDIFNNFIDGVLDLVVGFVKGVIGWFENLYQTLVGGSIVPDLVNGIIRWFGKLPGKLLGIAKSVSSGVTGKFKNMGSNVVTAVGSLQSKVKNKFSNMKSSVKDKVSTMKSSVSSKFKGLKDSVISSAKSIYSGVKERFNKLKSINLFSAGKNVLGTFISGINSKVSSLSSSLSGAASKIKSFLGFSSPTEEGPGRYADEWMPNLFEMLKKGIIQGKKKLEFAMKYTSTALMPQVSSVPTGGTTTNNNTPITVNVYADSLTNGRSVGKELVKELNQLGIITHKGI